MTKTETWTPRPLRPVNPRCNDEDNRVDAMCAIDKAVGKLKSLASAAKKSGRMDRHAELRTMAEQLLKVKRKV